MGLYACASEAAWAPRQSLSGFGKSIQSHRLKEIGSLGGLFGMMGHVKTLFLSFCLFLLPMLPASASDPVDPRARAEMMRLTQDLSEFVATTALARS